MTSTGKLRDYHSRCAKRAERHGNWRQTYYDCMGMCQFRLPDGSICGEVDYLEFHAPQGEEADEITGIKERVLLCRQHHREEHGGNFPEERGYLPLLQEDVAYEIDNCGSIEVWKKHYKIKDKEVTVDKAIDVG